MDLYRIFTVIDLIKNQYTIRKLVLPIIFLDKILFIINFVKSYYSNNL
jgi:hypothetical protein